jgi:dTDP-4-dehydrorhamnose 3,5-epimerase
MIFHPTPLLGAFTIELEKKGDERGFFARTFCVKEFEQYNIEHRIVQINNSFSAHKGTLRGLHYQLEPHAETKIVRCIRGALYDVILDLRKDSSTFGHWYGAELTAENRMMMVVPKGFAHAFLTLEDNTEAIYLVSEYYAPHAERGIRWNDPRFGISWPIQPTTVSDKDQKWPDFNPAYHLGRADN